MIKSDEIETTENSCTTLKLIWEVFASFHFNLYSIGVINLHFSAMYSTQYIQILDQLWHLGSLSYAILH